MVKKATAKNVSAVAVLVTAMADFAALSSDERCTRFAEKAQVNRVSFSEMGKLHYLISEDVAAWNAANPKKKQRTIYDELRKRGVADKSISNASYASRAWRALVVEDHITEAQFDSLTFQDCFAIARSMSQRAALQLDGAAVGELITKQPDDFDLELASLYEHGVTVAEKKAQDEKAEADRIKALVDAQNASKTKPEPTPSAPTQAAQQTQQSGADLQSAGAGSAKAEGQENIQHPTSNTQPPTEDPTATTEEENGRAGDTETETGEAEETGTGASSEPPESASGEAEEESHQPPSNVTTMPQAEANPDANLEAMIDVLSEIAAESEAFTAEGQATLLAKLDEVRAAVAARLESAAAA
ncbi:MAG: hypothetical protein QOE70_902 [Chthoniobacter sp.]|jgi:hypothetical protein|nr:hypothetical protein [Chthoniobacter sp.]